VLLVPLIVVICGAQIYIMVWLLAYLQIICRSEPGQTRGERQLKARHWLIAKTLKPITS
jgi:hypothetical protein